MKGRHVAVAPGVCTNGISAFTCCCRGRLYAYDCWHETSLPPFMGRCPKCLSGALVTADTPDGLPLAFAGRA